MTHCFGALDGKHVAIKQLFKQKPFEKVKPKQPFMAQLSQGRCDHLELVHRQNLLLRLLENRKPEIT